MVPLFAMTELMADESASSSSDLDCEHEHDPLIPGKIRHLVVHHIQKPDLEVKLDHEVSIKRKCISPVFLHGFLLLWGTVSHIQWQPVVQKADHTTNEEQIWKHAACKPVEGHMHNTNNSGREETEVLKPLEVDNHLLALCSHSKLLLSLQCGFLKISFKDLLD